MSDTTHEAPVRLWIDPDILPPEWDKQYYCDVEYVRIDLVEAAEQQGYSSAIEAERKLHEDRIEELEAKLAKAVESLRIIEDASRFYARDRAASDTETLSYAHETTRRLCTTTLAELKGQDYE